MRGPSGLTRWAVTLVTGMWSVWAGAVIVNLDQFTITKNGATFFSDSFTDGAPPPSAPNFPNGQSASYNVFGAIPSTAESGGVLQLDSANGGLTANANGDARLTLRAMLLTNADSSDLASGLKSDDTLDLKGVFGLTSPTGPLINGYGIRFGDRDAAGVKQLAELDVRFNPDTGQVEVRYIIQDFDAGTITELGNTLFAPPSSADQIQLEITRGNTLNNNFLASFAYLSGGSVVGGGAFATPAVLFQGENFVRAEFIAFQAVPEPSAIALIGLGLAGLAALGRRKK